MHRGQRCQALQLLSRTPWLLLLLQATATVLQAASV
jgi:hypothetical protein